MPRAGTLHYLRATADMGRRRPFDAERSIALALSLCPDNKYAPVQGVASPRVLLGCDARWI